MSKKTVKGVPRDFDTGLTHNQLKAAKLLAEGLSAPKVAAAVGVHHQTIHNWKKIEIFGRVMREYRPPQQHAIALLPMREHTPEALDERLAQLVCPAVEAMGHVLGSPQSSDMAKIQASKFVLSTLYQRWVHSQDVAPEQLKDLKEALRVIK